VFSYELDFMYCVLVSCAALR